MKSDELFRLIGEIDPDLIEQAEPKAARRRGGFLHALAMSAACFAVVAAIGVFAALQMNGTKAPLPTNPPTQPTAGVGESKEPSTGPTQETEPSDRTDTQTFTSPTEPTSPTDPKPTDEVLHGDTINHNLGDVSAGPECKVHAAEYHSIPAALVDYIGGYPAMEKWGGKAKTTVLDGDAYCTAFTIKAFIDFFDIPRNVFEDAIAGDTVYYHDVGLLYSDDLAAIDAYYRDRQAREQTYQKRCNLENLRIKLYQGRLDGDFRRKEGIDMTEIEKRVAHHRASIPYLIAYFKIPRGEVEGYIRDMEERGALQYDYRLDLIYGEDGAIRDLESVKKLSTVRQDALFAGVDNLYTD